MVAGSSSVSSRGGAGAAPADAQCARNAVRSVAVPEARRRGHSHWGWGCKHAKATIKCRNGLIVLIESEMELSLYLN